MDIKYHVEVDEKLNTIMDVECPGCGRKYRTLVTTPRPRLNKRCLCGESLVVDSDTLISEQWRKDQRRAARIKELTKNIGTRTSLPQG